MNSSIPTPNDEVATLLEERGRIDNQITYALQRAQGNNRPMWHCYRCGYEWRGHRIDRVPRHCARCHSSSWMQEEVVNPRGRERKPTDPPNPKWYRHRRRGFVSSVAPSFDPAAQAIVAAQVEEARANPSPPQPPSPPPVLPPPPPPAAIPPGYMEVAPGILRMIPRAPESELEPDTIVHHGEQGAPPDEQ